MNKSFSKSSLKEVIFSESYENFFLPRELTELNSINFFPFNNHYVQLSSTNQLLERLNFEKYFYFSAWKRENEKLIWTELENYEWRVWSFKSEKKEYFEFGRCYFWHSVRFLNLKVAALKLWYTKQDHREKIDGK